MAYQVNRYNGAFLVSVEDGTIDTTTDLRFVGKNYAGYGEIQNENFLHLLESFAGVSAPPKSVAGQIWYDSVTKKLKFYDGSQYKVASGAVVSTTAPAGLVAGDLWFNDTSKQLYTWSGTNFVLIGPAAAPEAGASGAISRTIQDTLGTPVPIVELQAGGVTLAIVSKVDFIIGNINPIVGFNRVKKGITLVNTDATSGITTPAAQQYFWGTASNALKLGGLEASVFLQKGDLNFDEQAWFRNDNGFYLGAGKELLVHKESQDPFAGSTGGDPNRDEDQIVIEQRQANSPITLRFKINDNTSLNLYKIRSTGIFPALSGNLNLGGTVGSTSYVWKEVHASNLYGVLNGNIVESTNPAATPILNSTSRVLTANINANNGTQAFDATNKIFYGQLGSPLLRTTVYGDVSGDVSGEAGTAKKLGTYSPNVAAVASTVVVRDTSGNINATSFIGTATQADTLNVSGSYRTASTVNSFNTIAVRDGVGTLHAEIFDGTALAARYADLAEKYLADKEYEVGTVVVVGGEKEVTASSYGDLAIGAVSINPALMMNKDLEGGTYIALKGRVPVKVIGMVQKGDRLVATDWGCAKSATDRLDTFAIALESSDDAGIKLVESVIL
jgi:hypothetical protein